MEHAVSAAVKGKSVGSALAPELRTHENTDSWTLKFSRCMPGHGQGSMGRGEPDGPVVLLRGS